MNTLDQIDLDTVERAEVVLMGWPHYSIVKLHLRGGEKTVLRIERDGEREVIQHLQNHGLQVEIWMGE